MRMTVLVSMALGLSIGVVGQSAEPNQSAPATQAPQAARPARPTPPCGPGLAPEIKNVDPQSRCFELRTYTVQPGSSIDLLHSRFRDHSIALFKKHGMTVVAFWQPVTKPDTLVYLLAYKDAAARDASWAAFQSDPEWIKTRTEMAVNLQVDNIFMSATDYSPLK